MDKTIPDSASFERDFVFLELLPLGFVDKVLGISLVVGYKMRSRFGVYSISKKFWECVYNITCN